MSTRAELITKVREGWPNHAFNTGTEKRGTVEVPPVRDGGLTALIIDYAVDTVLAALHAQLPAYSMDGLSQSDLETDGSVV